MSTFRNNDYRRTKRSKKPSPPSTPPDIETAACALMAAVEAKYGLDDIVYVWINPTYVEAFFADRSEAGLVRWRSEREAECGVIPSSRGA